MRRIRFLKRVDVLLENLKNRTNRSPTRVAVPARRIGIMNSGCHIVAAARTPAATRTTKRPSFVLSPRTRRARVFILSPFAGAGRTTVSRGVYDRLWTLHHLKKLGTGCKNRQVGEAQQFWLGTTYTEHALAVPAISGYIRVRLLVQAFRTRACSSQHLG